MGTIEMKRTDADVPSPPSRADDRARESVKSPKDIPSTAASDGRARAPNATTNAKNATSARARARDIGRELAGALASSSTATPFSARGPHPTERKRRVGGVASEAMDRVLRRAIVLRPSEEDLEIMSAVRAERGLGVSRARRAVMEMERTRARADSVAAELLELGIEIREVAYMPGDELGFMRLIDNIGVIVVAIPPTLQGKTLLELLRVARSRGVLVMLSALVGHYLEHVNHLDIAKTKLMPSKRVPPQALGLVERCETRDDGYREITLHVLSMPGTSSERNVLRNRILPRLRSHCRDRRLRLHYVDLKDDCPQAGPGQAVNALAHAMKMGGIFVVLLSGNHEIDWYSSAEMRNYVEFMKSEADTRAVNDVAWMKHAPNDYSRIEMLLGHLLRVYDDLDRKSVQEQTKHLTDLSRVELKRMIEAREHAEDLRSQHVLAYAPNLMLYEKIEKLKDEQVLEFMVSQDPYLRERIGSLVSTIYAHPEANLTFYSCRLLPPVSAISVENVTKITQLPRTTVLAEFENTIFEDILSRINEEFKSNDVEDKILQMSDCEPELSLNERLPFYAHRAAEEKVLMKAMKTGQPNMNVVMGFAGGGTTTILQYCARRARAMFAPTGDRATIDKVTILSDYGFAEGRIDPTPTQILRNLALQLKRLLGFDDHIPASLDAVRAVLMVMFRRATEGRGRVIVFIDALHRVSNPAGIAWLPHEHEVPFGVQFFLGILRVDKKPVADESKMHESRKMPAVEYSLVNSYRQRMYTLQHISLAASCPLAMKNATSLDALKFEDRRAYAMRFLRPLGVRLTNNMTVQTMDKFCTGNFRGMFVMCSRLAMADPYDANFGEAMSKLPHTTRDHYHQLFAGIEKLLPMDVLICALPVITCSCGILTRDDLARILHKHVFPKVAVPVINETSVMSLLWAARFIIKGGSSGGYGSTPNDPLIVDDIVAHDVIMERYASKEASKRMIYTMIAQHFGDRVTGRQILGRLRALKSKQEIGMDPFKRNEHGEYVSSELNQEYHMTFRTLEYLPYFLTQARMFDMLVELLTDVDFMQAKVMIGEIQALIDDFDRVLPTTYGPERPLWISTHLSSNEEVLDVPGAPSGIDGKLRQLAIYNSHCLGFHMEAYQYHASRSASNRMTQDLASIRDVLWRNLETLHKSPQIIRQVFYNDVPEAAPRRFCTNGLVEASESAMRDANGLERFVMRWENRPDEELSDTAFRSAFERGGEVKCVCWLDDATFAVGYSSGGLEVWSAKRGEAVARFVGHERAVTTLIVLNHDANRNARTAVYVVSGSKDKTIRFWRLDDSLGRECATLTGHTMGITSLAMASATNELFSAAGTEIRCWSCTAGYPLLYTFNTEHTAPVSSIAVAGDLSFMITASFDGIMRLWQFTTNGGSGNLNSLGSSTVYQKDRGADDDISGFVTLERSSNGGASSRGGLSRKSGIASMPPAVTLELRGHLGDVTCTACTVSGNLFASGGVDQSIMVWEPKNGKHVGLIQSHAGAISALKFSNDGRLLVSASLDRTCKVFNPLTGALLASLHHCTRVSHVDISSDSSSLVSGTTDGSIRLWNWLGREGSTSTGNVPRGANLLRRAHDKKGLRAVSNQTISAIHEGKVLSSCHLDVGNAGSCFVTGGVDGAVRVLFEKDWKLVNDITPLQSQLVDAETSVDESSITAMCAAPEESVVYFGKSSGMLAGWNFNTNAWAWPDDQEVSAHASAIESVMTLNESTLVTADARGMIQVWSIGGLSPSMLRKLTSHNACVHSLCAESQTSFYSASADRIVKRWDAERGTYIDFAAHDLAVTGCAFSAHGLVTAGADGFIKLWDARSGVESRRFRFFAGIPLKCEAIVEQPNWVAVLGDAGLHVYDMRTSGEILSFSSPYGFSRRAESALSACAFNRYATRAIVADAFGRVHGCSTALVATAIDHEY